MANTKVLAAGAGSLLVSLGAALFEAGFEAELLELTMPLMTVTTWREKIQLFDWVLYVNEQVRIEEIKSLHTACRVEKKSILTGLCMGQTVLVAPWVHPNSEGGYWESAWRRLHRSAIRNITMKPNWSPITGQLLSNIIAYKMKERFTRGTESELNNELFLFDLSTLEGDYHSFLPHPLVTGGITTERIPNVEQLLKRHNSTREEPTDFLTFMSHLTSPQTGILHLWEEGGLQQLPLSQCHVQAVDPLTEGPVDLLPAVIGAGLTHIEARREAGLAGIEGYVTRLVGLNGIGSGVTFEEALYRGLQKGLMQQLRLEVTIRQPVVYSVQLHSVEDTYCRYYLQALTMMQEAPTIGWGEDMLGFPVVWVKSGDCWYGSVGLNRTLALRMTLQQALLKAQNPKGIPAIQGLEIPTVALQEAILTKVDIERDESSAHAKWLRNALPILKQHQTRISIDEIKVEPYLNEHLGGLLVVWLEEEEASK